MRLRARTAGAWLAGLLLLLVPWVACAKDRDGSRFVEYEARELSGEGGCLVTLWSRGPDRLDAPRTLRVSRGGVHRELELGAVQRVRWRSCDELVVERSRRRSGGAAGRELLRVAATGETLELLSEDVGLAGAEPFGAWLLLERIERTGSRSLELRQLGEGFRRLRHYPRSAMPGRGGLSAPVWSPDGTRFALATDEPASAHEPARLLPRLTLGRRDAVEFSRLRDSVEGEAPARWAVVPLFWSASGIHVRSPRGLLRCDPGGGGCTPLYDPGPRRAVSAGRAVGRGRALLLVRDLEVDPYELRAKEIHEVDLASGMGRRVLRLPEAVFVSDLDWLPEPTGRKASRP